MDGQMDGLWDKWMNKQTDSALAAILDVGILSKKGLVSRKKQKQNFEHIFKP